MKYLKAKQKQYFYKTQKHLNNFFCPYISTALSLLLILSCHRQINHILSSCFHFSQRALKKYIVFLGYQSTIRHSQCYQWATCTQGNCEQLEETRPRETRTHLPILLVNYFNPVNQAVFYQYVSVLVSLEYQVHYC